MKKLMIAFAAVAVAASVNAAAVEWGVTGVPNSPANALIGETDGVAHAYLFAAADYTTVSEALAKGDLSAITGYISDTESYVGRGGAGFAGVTADILSPGQSYNGFIVMVDSVAAKDAKYYALVEPFTTLEAGDGGNVTFSTDFTSWKEVQSIPEPTSGLLLLLGVAGLALRRRRA